MEVHTHTHLAPGETHTARKKWTHYFWEFLMLFLAVFCGFLAEYQLEHMLENQREKKFMQSMIKDLQTDTVLANGALKYNLERIEKYDSLLFILDQPAVEKMDSRNAYYLNVKFLTNWSPLDFARNTFTQLKNGGNMRMIRNQKVVDTLNWLDAFMLGMDNQKASVDKMMDQANDIAVEIFNTSYFREGGKFHGADYILKSVQPPAFMTRDLSVFQKYANRVSALRGTMLSYIAQLKYYMKLSTQVMLLIKKEYHIK